MVGAAREDGIKNEYARGGRRLFGHVMRREKTKAVWVIRKMNVEQGR